MVKTEDLPRVRTLYAKLDKIDQIKSLSLSDMQLTSRDMQVTSKALYQAKNLKKLFLNGNAIDDEGMASLAFALRDGAAPNLKQINLGGNQRAGMTESSCSRLKGAREGITLY
jgi:Ran GTPase-activating protein (RanGAP) involved in mRNA processing and transport